jgi:CheY-like chemotaxis protein
MRGSRRRRRPRRPVCAKGTRCGHPRGQAGGRARGGGVRIVLADDEALLPEGLARLLVEAGFEVVGTAQDAAGLLRLVEARRPALVITDIKMPPSRTDEGLIAAQEIRQTLSRGRRPPSLALPRVALRDVACRGAPRTVGMIPAQGPRLGNWVARGCATPHWRRRVRHRPDDRVTPGKPPPKCRAASRAHRARARCARPHG